MPEPSMSVTATDVLSTLDQGYALHRLITDDDGTPVDYEFLDVNPAFERLTGLGAKSVVGKTALEVMPQTEAVWIERYGHVALTGEPVSFDEYSAEIGRWFRVAATCPSHGYFAVIFYDITDMRETYEHMDRAKRETQSLLGASRAVLAAGEFQVAARKIFDACRAVTGAQSGYVALMSEDGAENEVLFLEAGGLPCTVDPELPMPIRGLRAKAYDSAQVVYENELGSSEWVDYMPAGHVDVRNVMFAPLTVEGRVLGVMGLANKPTDYTEEDARIASDLGDLAAIALSRVRAEELLANYSAKLEDTVTARTREIAQANYDLELANAAMNRFLANMSHELRTPLNSIIGFSGTMQQGLAGPLNDEQRQQVNMIKSSGERLLELISDVLDVSKIEAGGTAPEIRQFDAAHLIRECVKNVRLDAEARDIRLRAEGVEQEFMLTSDKGKVRQIILNLLSNAIKFTEDGTVFVGLERIENGMRVSVADTGIGIPESDFGGVFDGFVQLKHPRLAKSQGAGLGLTLAQEHAALLGGGITVDSVPGEGSTFTLDLPSLPEQG
ncbi:MAG: ATP-binding protein [Actinomycetota bacterium]|jgi:PAS domain S-box-containing protein|nr:ATP-binding protein [Actinomycetota bacterium]